MDLKSKRVWLGIAAGVVINLIAARLELSCWSAVLGAIVALYVGKVYSPRQGAVVGTIVLLPVTVLFVWQVQERQIFDLTRLSFATAFGLIGAILFLAAVGAAAGAAIGLALRELKKRQLLF